MARSWQPPFTKKKVSNLPLRLRSSKPNRPITCNFLMPRAVRAVFSSLQRGSLQLTQSARTVLKIYGFSHSTGRQGIRPQISSRRKSVLFGSRRTELGSVWCAGTTIRTSSSCKKRTGDTLLLRSILERRRLRHPHPEASQSRVRETAIAGLRSVDLCFSATYHFRQWANPSKLQRGTGPPVPRHTRCPAGLARHGSRICDRRHGAAFAIAIPPQACLIPVGLGAIRERERLIICNKQ
jgi:hypothetical protein